MILSPIVDREMPTTDRKHDIRTTEKRRKQESTKRHRLVAYASWIKGGWVGVDMERLYID